MMLRVAIILGISLVLWCGYSPRAHAQEPVKIALTGPTKFDEFNTVGHCDLTARLDNIAISLPLTPPGTTAQLIVYGPEGDRPGSGRSLLAALTDYLISMRGVETNRIKAIYGGRNSDLHEPRIQLWLIPDNTLPPEPEKYETNIDTFKGMFSEHNLGDDVGFYYEPEMGPGIGTSDDASFADMLHQRKNTVGYIVAYNGEDATPGAWRRVAETKVEHLKNFKLDASRFKIIFGGRKAETKVQLWILPKDEPPPVRDAGRELPPTKAIKSAESNAYILGQADNADRLFARLRDVLRNDKKLRAFVVVRLPLPPSTEVESEVNEEEDDPAPVELEQSEPVHLTTMVEKWRFDLTTTYKIRHDRIIVIVLPGKDYDSDSLELWFVPKGQPLPDPTKEEGEDPEPAPKVD
jgi:hypothetical protein